MVNRHPSNANILSQWLSLLPHSRVFKPRVQLLLLLICFSISCYQKNVVGFFCLSPNWKHTHTHTDSFTYELKKVQKNMWAQVSQYTCSSISYYQHQLPVCLNRLYIFWSFSRAGLMTH